MGNKKSTLVSVVIPTHNRYELLKNAVHSVCLQTTKPSEIVIVDDNSLLTISRNDFDCIIPLKIIRLDKTYGPGYSRNVGVNASEGDLIVFLDDDDMFFPEAIENHIKMQRADNICATFHDAFIISGNEIRYSRKIYNMDLSQMMFRTYINTVSCLCISKKLFCQLGGFNESLLIGEDLDLYIRILKRNRIVATNFLGVRREIHDCNITLNSEEWSHCLYRIYHMHLPFAKSLRLHKNLRWGIVRRQIRILSSAKSISVRIKILRFIFSVLFS